MATCTPVSNVPKQQATLFSFMKKKDPNEPKVDMNFVTPAEKKCPLKKSVEGSAASEGNDQSAEGSSGEQDESIERLVTYSSASAVKSDKEDSVVDLTSIPEATPANSKAGAATKRRRQPTKKTPAKATVQPKTISSAFESCPNDVSAPIAEDNAEVMGITADASGSTITAATDSNAAPDVLNSTTDIVTVAPTAHAVVTPAPSASKKRSRKPSSKKVQAKESEALNAAESTEHSAEIGDIAGEAGDEAYTPEGEEKVTNAADAAPSTFTATKPTPKRIRKPPVKPTPQAIVYPAHVEVKLQSNRDKISTLVQELISIERTEDCLDTELLVPAAVADLMDAVRKPPLSTNEMESVEKAPEVEANADAADAAAGADVAEPMQIECEEIVSSEEPAADTTTVATTAEPITESVSDAPGEVMEVVDTAAVPVPVPEPACEPITAEETAKSHLTSLVGAIIARSIQGSSGILRDVVEVARANLESALAQVKDLMVGGEDSNPDVATVEQAEHVLDILNNLIDPVVLAEEVKSLAVRQTYGNRTEKSLMFDCTDVNAVWRWEVHSMQYFTKSAQNTIREARTVRGRYSRAIKAIFKVIEQLLKVPYSDAKLSPLEERSAKCLTEVEKAKEKRRELEVKRAADAIEKRRKEELREQKRVEKEEADRVRREAAAAAAAAKAAQASVEKEKKAPVVNEKAAKKALEIEKSKNAFMSFLNRKSSADATAIAPETPACTAASSSSSVQKSPTAATLSSAVEAKQDRLARFDEAMQQEMSIADIMAYQRKRFGNLPKKRKLTSKRAKYIDLHVTVIVPDPRRGGAFDAADNTYSEIQEKRFRNKVRTLSFWEDHRPAYVGTVSRKTNVITGRRPLAKDTELLNYEYDSEEDWEEEVEGEDLNDTDEEEEDGGANELEYDDFFCRDDDFGSDAEGDMDGAAMKVCHRNVIEVFGPRFMGPSQVAPVLVEMRVEEGADRPSAFIRKVDEPISSFSIMDLATGELVLQSSKNDGDSNNLSSYSAVCYAQFPAPTLGVFPAKKSTHGSTAAAGSEAGVDAKPAFKGFDDAKLPELAKFIHGKKEGIDKIVLGFHALNPTFSKLQIQKKIKEITDKAKHTEGFGTARFLLKQEVIDQLQIKTEDLDEVIFTPQKKKKRAAVTLIASNLEELQSKGGASSLLPPAGSSSVTSSSAGTIAATLLKTPAVVTTSTTSTVATSSSSSAAITISTAVDLTGAKEEIVVATDNAKPRTKPTKPKAPKTPRALKNPKGVVTPVVTTSAEAVGSTASEEITDTSESSAKKTVKRKAKTAASSGANKKKKQVSAAIVVPSTDANNLVTESPAVTPAPAPAAILAPVVPATAVSTVSGKAQSAVSSMKKITCFLVTPAQKTSTSTSSNTTTTTVPPAAVAPVAPVAAATATVASSDDKERESKASTGSLPATAIGLDD